MNILLLDQTASFLDFALRCKAAGHYPRLCIARDKETKQRVKTGDGLVEKIENEDWQRHASWADLILTSDNVKWLHELDLLRKKGYPVFAPSYESAQLELDRAKGQALFKKVGISVGDYETFSDFAKAEKYVASEMKRFVLKPMGDKDKALSYVSKSPRDMIFTLRRFAKQAKTAGTFMLQEYVEGIEFGVAGWMGKNGFASFFEENFEHKKLMPGDYGPNTGEMGTACKYVKDSALAKEVLLPLEGELLKMGHRGSVDVSVIIDDESGNPLPLEFTTRLGWPSCNIVQELHMECCEWMADLVDGKDSFDASSDIAVGVVVAIPPFPYPKQDKQETLGIPLYNLDEDNPYRNYLAPCDVILGEAPDEEDGKIVERKMMVSCGDYLAIATGCGGTVREAADEAYKAVKSLELPSNPIVRDDIGKCLKEDIPKLQDYGFASEWTY